jgi:uncharacterized protein (TIGR02099 family)
MFFAILMMTVAIMISLFRALTPLAKQYKKDVEHHLSLLMGQPVQIRSIETSWYWFQPVLRLNHVTVFDQKHHALTLEKLLVGINLFRSLWHGYIQPGILYMDDLHVTLRQVGHHWTIDGLQQDNGLTLQPLDAYRPFFYWLFEQQKIKIRNVSAMVHLKDGSFLPFGTFQLTAMQRGGHYLLKGQAKLAQTMATELMILADFQWSTSAVNKMNGHLYLSAHHVLPKQWQGFFPKSGYRLLGGQGDLDAWVDVVDGHLANIQTLLDFRRLSWGQEGHSKSQWIESLRANLAWRPTDDGWKLSGDRIQLNADGLRWPDNACLIQFQQSSQTYRVFLKTVLLPSLWSQAFKWPAVMQSVSVLHPTGDLSDLQLEIKNAQITHLITRFNDVSWSVRRRWPAVRHLSGALDWRSSTGRLDLDGADTIVEPFGLRAIRFSDLNAAFEWTELPRGIRISMKRLVLRHPNMLFRARGVFDEPFSPEHGHVQLSAEFSASQAQKWLAYFPSQYVKPKLSHWLKHDIRRIGNAQGQFTMDGFLVDFPFDKKPGEWRVSTYVSGVDFLIHKKWPPIKNFDGYLSAHQRSMAVDVLHASLLGVDVRQANIRIDNMGLGQESLLLHGKVDTPVHRLKKYVFSTPLRHHFSKLKQLDMNGTVGLELFLDIPLYPEKNDLLARGGLSFYHNQATFHYERKDVSLTNLSGLLQFDEKGVTESHLSAKLFGERVDLHIQSQSEPKPYTSIMMEGKIAIDKLREIFEFPLLSFMQGVLSLSSQWMITDDPHDLDHLELRTSLEGVEIDLPAPLGKSASEMVPLISRVDFNLEKTARFRMTYDKGLSSDLWFINKAGGFVLDKGGVLVGKGLLPIQEQKGLRVRGSLSRFDTQRWRRVWTQWPVHSTTPSWFETMCSVDMSFGEVILFGKRYPELGLKAKKLSREEVWSFQMDQKDIAADLIYHPSEHALSGHFTRLYLTQPLFIEKTGPSETPPLKPMDIPDLNLKVDAFRLGTVDVGHVVLKSTSSSDHWQLNDCQITSPEYQLALSGDWLLHEGKNMTTLQADLQMHHLGAGLTRWHITPVVDADKGVVQWNGHWPGSMMNFSLDNIQGDLSIFFQNGLITHLSRETEEKLGLGKLFSILSLQTIPRRLKLDFSDLSNTGYSFDVFKGDFVIQNGVMHTHNSYIDGPVAYASMKGDLDVMKRLYNVELHVSPHITASLPIVATIAGGPIAGVAAWVASKIINQGMQRVTGYTYKVSGPWLRPKVRVMSEKN